MDETTDPELLFELQKRIGEGSYGCVYEAIHKKTLKTVAIKIIPVEKDVGEMLKEIAILKSCNSSYIVRYYGSYYKDNDLWIVMEYCQGGSLSSLMMRGTNTLNENEIRYVMAEVLMGLEYLHKNHTIHRDIKSGNILLTENSVAKLADFGVSVQLENTVCKRQTVIGTPFWMAPEVIQERSYDCKADIWSLGITAIELADGLPPYANEHPMKAIFYIPQRPPPTLRNPSKWSSDFNNFIEKCLTKDPANRPSATELLQHPFIQVTAQRLVRNHNSSNTMRNLLHRLRSLREVQVAREKEEKHKRLIAQQQRKQQQEEEERLRKQQQFKQQQQLQEQQQQQNEHVSKCASEQSVQPTASTDADEFNIQEIGAHDTIIKVVAEEEARKQQQAKFPLPPPPLSSSSVSSSVSSSSSSTNSNANNIISSSSSSPRSQLPLPRPPGLVLPPPIRCNSHDGIRQVPSEDSYDGTVQVRESRQPRSFPKGPSSQGVSPPLHVPFRKPGQVVLDQQGNGVNIGAGNRLHAPFISNASPSPSVLMNELVRLLPDIPSERSGNSSHERVQNVMKLRMMRNQFQQDLEQLFSTYQQELQRIQLEIKRLDGL